MTTRRPNLARTVAKRVWITATAAARTPYVAVGHYYSPLTSPADVDRAIARKETNAVDTAAYDYDLAAEAVLFDELRGLFPRIGGGDRYHRDEMYELADASVYSAMLRRFAPKRVVEIGSGFSTAMALDTIQAHSLPTRITCVEPNTARLMALLRPDDTVEVIAEQVQDVPLSLFDQLERGDMLFIDSTHVVKPGSDVVHDMLSVLPRLRPGVLVHIHDIFWPFEYPAEWLRQRRDWNEIYLVEALLHDSRSWRILLFADRTWTPADRQACEGTSPAALWIEKVG